jgi:hypothetical protein
MYNSTQRQNPEYRIRADLVCWGKSELQAECVRPAYRNTSTVPIVLPQYTALGVQKAADKSFKHLYNSVCCLNSWRAFYYLRMSKLWKHEVHYPYYKNTVFGSYLEAVQSKKMNMTAFWDVELRLSCVECLVI